MGGTYWSVRLPVCRPPATGQFRQKSTIGIQLREKSTVDSRLREKKGRRRRGKEEKKKRGVPISPRHPCRCVVVAHGSPAHHRRPRVAGAFSPVRGDRTSPRAGRKVEATWGEASTTSLPRRRRLLIASDEEKNEVFSLS
ncbi:hypothetical protein BHE74_00005051 [Ensete ventricosum]|nr:hypothetical protein BHE74_00005051 [Ensete ventricosum]